MTIGELPAVTVDNSRSRAEPLLSASRFALLLGIMIVAAFPDIIIGARTFFFRDFGLFGYPLAHLHRESIWRGEIPLWNPFNDCGIPFLAQWNTMVLYPFSWLHALLPLSWSLGFFCLAHLFWGGLGMFFLGTRWTGSRTGGAVAGVAFAFSGLALNSLMWPNNNAALGWAPWVISGAELAWLRGGRSVFTAALTGAVQMLTGAPEVILTTWLVIGTWHLAGLLANWNASDSHPIARSMKQAGRLATVVLLVAGICAAQLLPFRDLLLHSHRDALPNSTGWAMPAWGWANLLVPLFRTHPAYFGVHLQPGQFWTASYYMGICALGLGIWAAAAVRGWRVLVLAGISGMGILLALGESGLVYPAVKAAFPQVGVMRYPIKCILLTALTVPLLAGYGIAAWEKATGSMSARRSLIWLTVALGIVVVWLTMNGHPSTTSVESQRLLWNGLSRFALLALTVAGLFVALRLKRPGAQAWAWAALPMIFWVDGLTHAPRLNPTAPRWIYDAGIVDELLPHPRPALGESRAMVSPQADYELQFSAMADPAKHCLSRRASLFNNFNLLDEVPKINGMSSLYPKYEAEVLTRMYACTDRYPSPLADFLAVSQVTSRTNLFSWEPRATARPMISGGQRPVFATASATLDALASPSFNPAAEVYLAPDLRAMAGELEAAEVKIEAVHFTPQKITFEVSSSDRALVVLAQTFYHWWNCTVDGKPVPLLQANHAFQAVIVPQGRHQLELRYVDRSFQVGCAVSLLTLAICAGGWLKATRLCQGIEQPARTEPA